MERAAGVLMHITSLPSPYGIGTVGKAAYEFADFLKQSGQTYWQILPVGPTGEGNSPYTSFSTFAGNLFLIDLDKLIEQGLLVQSDVDSFDWGNDASTVDFSKIEKYRPIVLYKAFENYIKGDTSELDEFIKENSRWLQDYAVYMAAKEIYGDISWDMWPDEAMRMHDETAINNFIKEHEKKVLFWEFTQFLFFTQWKEFKDYCNSTGIKIIGDIPIYVPLDSSDVWANSDSFCLDENKRPTNVSGCPPDAFSPTGQLWGHPLYNWEYMKEDNYSWWMERIGTLSILYDVTRIDHFRGFGTYYSIPNDGKENAVQRGKWCYGPGYHFFEVLESKFGDSVKIIAEDLGAKSEVTKTLLKQTGYPGMKVLSLAFDSRDNNIVLPHNYNSNYVIYTGTHDNDTIMGWFNRADKEDVKLATEYLHITDAEEFNWGFIRGTYQSVCNLAIIPMQDLLGYGSSARMNTPSTVGNNWKWRMEKSIDLSEISSKLCKLCKLYER